MNNRESNNQSFGKEAFIVLVLFILLAIIIGNVLV